MNEEELHNSERILQRVIDLLPSRIFWKDSNSVYLGCNKNFALDAGKKKPEDLIGKTDYEMGWAEQAELYRADDKKVISSGEDKINYDEPQTTPDGKTIWLRTSKVPLKDVDGAVIGVLGIYEDITERKLAHDKIELQNEELVKMNRLMTGREMKMKELKEKIESLEARIKTLESTAKQ